MSRDCTGALSISIDRNTHEQSLKSSGIPCHESAPMVRRKNKNQHSKASSFVGPLKKHEVRRTANHPSPVHGPRNQRKIPRTAAHDSLSPCVRDYATALVDPFDGPLTCIPSSFPPIPSWKTRVWCRGTLSTGTNGIGFAFVNPKNIFVNNTGSILTSGVTYAGTGFPNSAADVGTIQNATNAPYAAAAISDANPLGVQFRMVSVGVRCWYTGSELNLQGEMISFRQPDNNSAAGLTTTQLLQFGSTRRAQVTSERATLECRWIPTKPSELEFQGTIDGVGSMGITVTGPASSANIFGFEVFGICEYIGATVTSRSPSHADPAGFAAVLTAVQAQGDSWYGSARDAAVSLLKASAQALGELSGSRGGRAAMSMGASYAMNSVFGLPNLSLMPNIGGRATVEEIDNDLGIVDTQPVPRPTQPVPPTGRSSSQGPPSSVPQEVVVPDESGVSGWLPVWLSPDGKTTHTRNPERDLR